MSLPDPHYLGLPPGFDVVFDFSIPTDQYPQPGYDVVFDFSLQNSFTTFRSLTGELGAVELTVNNSSLGTILCPTGEKASTDLQLDWRINFTTGELAQVTTIAITQILGSMTAWSGELAFVPLFSAAYAITPSARTGEKTACTLTPGVAANLGTIVVPTGEKASTDTIVGSWKLQASGQTGEKATAEVQEHPLILFVTNVMPTGEHLLSTLAAFNTYTSAIRTGEKAACTLTVTGPILVVVKTGEKAATELNQGFILLQPLKMQTGECIINAIINVNPAFHPIANFTTGEKGRGELLTHPRAIMTARATTGEEFWAATSDQTRWIDLAYDRNPHDSFYTWWDDVYNQMGTWIIIDTFENQFPSIVHDVGINQFATATLSTRARFTGAIARTGEHMHHEQSWGVLNWPTGNPTSVPIGMFNGQQTKCQLEANIKIPLCVGNIIPDPDFVFIELSSPYGDPCESWWIRTGETALVARGGFLVLPSLGHPVCPTGEVCHAELIPDPPWIAIAHTGEVARAELWNEPSMRPVFRTGEKGTAALAELNAHAQDGAIAIVVSMHTNYDVFFDERGCVLNEFVPQTPDGDNDFANAPPATPRELDPFKHFILSHCE